MRRIRAALVRLIVAAVISAPRPSMPTSDDRQREGRRYRLAPELLSVGVGQPGDLNASQVNR
jgi:hypothetical protein